VFTRSALPAVGGLGGVQVTPTPGGTRAVPPPLQQRRGGSPRGTGSGRGGWKGTPALPGGSRGDPHNPERDQPPAIPWRAPSQRAPRAPLPAPGRVRGVGAGAGPSRAGGWGLGAVSLRDGWLQVAAAVSVL